MSKTPKTAPEFKPDNQEQSKRFEETARQLEADESGKQFQRAMKAVAPPKSGGKTKSPAGSE